MEGYGGHHGEKLPATFYSILERLVMEESEAGQIGFQMIGTEGNGRTYLPLENHLFKHDSMLEETEACVFGQPLTLHHEPTGEILSPLGVVGDGIVCSAGAEGGQSLLTLMQGALFVSDPTPRAPLV